MAQYEHYILKKFEPKGRTQISKKIKKAYRKMSQGKELDILTEQNIKGMLSNLSSE